MVDLLVGDGDFGVGGYRVSAVQVAVVAREVRAGDLDSDAVTFLEQV